MRRVNARYVIATSAKVDIKGLDEKTLEKIGGESYFTREKKSGKKGEEEFFKQGEKPEVRLTSFHIPIRTADQKKTNKNNRKRSPHQHAHKTKRQSTRRS